MAKVVADQQTRQGGRGRPVLLVLVGSLFLLGIYMVSLLVWSGSTTPTSPQQSSSQQSTNPSTGSSNASRVPATNPTSPANTVPSANPAR